MPIFLFLVILSRIKPSSLTDYWLEFHYFYVSSNYLPCQAFATHFSSGTSAHFVLQYKRATLADDRVCSWQAEEKHMKNPSEGENLFFWCHLGCDGFHWEGWWSTQACKSNLWDEKEPLLPRIMNSHQPNCGTTFVLPLSGNVLADASRTYMGLKKFTLLNMNVSFYYVIFIHHPSHWGGMRTVYMGVMLSHGVNTHSTSNASDFVHFLPSGSLDYHHHRWTNTLGHI